MEILNENIGIEQANINRSHDNQYLMERLP